MPACSYVVEELSSACVSIANVDMVHYLGVIGVMASWNTSLINKIFRDVAEGQRTGNPCLISLAITEPGAGTDVEEVELIDKGRVSCYAQKVKGGYVVNGSKIFISMGHVSTWCCLIAYTNLKKPSENTIVFAVKTGTKGFSFGKHEDKMGQRSCPASELIFQDCFIPDEKDVQPIQAPAYGAEAAELPPSLERFNMQEAQAEMAERFKLSQQCLVAASHLMFPATDKGTVAEKIRLAWGLEPTETEGAASYLMKEGHIEDLYGDYNVLNEDFAEQAIFALGDGISRLIEVLD